MLQQAILIVEGAMARDAETAMGVAMAPMKAVGVGGAVKAAAVLKVRMVAAWVSETKPPDLAETLAAERTVGVAVRVVVAPPGKLQTSERQTWTSSMQ